MPLFVLKAKIQQPPQPAAGRSPALHGHHACIRQSALEIAGKAAHPAVMQQPHSLHLSSEALHVTVLSRGATLAAVRMGKDHPNLLIGFPNRQDHIDVPIYAGNLVGPIANRIKDGQIQLNGQKHQMARNEAGLTALHSGPEGIHAHDWRIVAQDSSRIELALSLRDGDQGLPGNREITAIYNLSGAVLTIEITAQSDQPTPMNIAAHPYWKLDDLPDVSGHRLLLHAPTYLPVDEHTLPTGQIVPVAGTIFDFTSPRAVPLTPELDVNYCLATDNRQTAQPCATLTGATGVTLDIATTAPGLQVYNGSGIPALEAVLEEGRALGPYGGIALEPQFWPDAPHHPHFPKITLNPGVLWRQLTTYQLSAP